jgi:tryptophan-rich sensory protein
LKECNALSGHILSMGDTMKRTRKTYTFWILLSVGIGALSGFLSREGAATFSETVVQPPLSPPAWLFPVVWSILYALMGISAARISLAPDSPQKKQGLNLFIIQLVLNFFWSLIFFNLQAYGLAFLWLIALWIAVFLMILSFRKTDPVAAYLQIPYLLWLTFAGYLSFAVWQLN